MRKKRAFKSTYRTIKRYEEEVTIISKNKVLELESGNFVDSSTEKVDKLAVFKNKSKYVYQENGIEKSADIKIYSTVEITEGDNSERVADVIELKNGLKYKVVFVDKREESSPVVYIAYGEEYDN